MKLRDVVLGQLNPTEVSHFYLGEEERRSGNSLVYYSPLRQKERTPSFFVDNIRGIHDFGTGKHYDIISFVGELFEIDYWKATKKLVVDFNLDTSKELEVKYTKRDYTSNEKFFVKLEKGNIPDNIICYFDSMRFDRKPNINKKLAGIKNRIQENEFTNYNNIEEIQQEILNGKTCIPSAIRGNSRETWKQQQIFLIDFDNKINGENITIDNEKHVTEEQIIDYCEKNNILPTFIYNTFSHTEQQHKFRLVYVFEEPITNIKVAQEILKIITDQLKQFNPDKSKKNLSDMFLGGFNIVYTSNNYYKVISENKNEKVRI